ncbi:MAG: Flp pilus assembly complex ATPase component TadA [Thermodesulfovibrionales bacterium]|nr:Flp pilus assembly complex ATPase component TadA [Thermodesulfovibrionales bacterium]
MQFRKRIGDHLIEAGLITKEQLEIALEEQKKTGELIGAILYGHGFISQKDLFTVLSMSYSGEYTKDKEEGIDLPHDMKDIVRQSSAVLKTTVREPEKISDISMVPIVQLVERIITTGIKKGATDIHIGPDVRGTRVRYRIDGLLQHGMYLPKDVLPAIVSRVKIMGSMNIAESRVPQDGSTEFVLDSKALDIRISTFPLVGGENIVLRILDKSQLLLGLENLRFLKDNIEILKQSLSMPFGMIIVTGPTGSGKTTTLYSALSTINSVFKNIYTIEDPIEYQLPLIRQSQVNIKAGLTFASGLRSILRQDPDVILVGEMRDMETAELAIRSALTGHLVFTTLHTNNAASSLPRLIDMGVEPFLLASTIDTIISQRLVRILCNKCKEGYSPTSELIESIGVPVPEDAIFYRAKGCGECNDTGYRGRTIIYEIMKTNESLRKLVLTKTGSDILSDAARKSGMETMYEIGIKKVILGITSLEEVISTTRTVF